MTRNIFLKTDEFNEALKALEIVYDFLPKVIIDNYFWKWVVLSLHNAVQGFMVCTLRGSNGLNVLKDDIRDQWLEAYRRGSGDYPPEILDTYLNLYKKIKSDKMVMFYHSKKFSPEGQQGWSIKKLNRLRNKFIHYLPGGFLLEVSGLPNIIDDCLAVIKFLVFESGNIWIDMDKQDNISKLITKIKADISEIKEVYLA